jgi:thymidylate kinase
MERTAAARGWLDGLAFMVLLYAHLEPALFGSSLVADAQVARFAEVLRAEPALQRRLDRLRSASEVDLPLPLGFWFCKRLYYRKVLRDPALDPRQRWRDVGATLAWGIKLKAHQRPQSGAVITLSGPDGAGKTAHARALVDALNLCEVRSHYLWSRGGSTGLLAITRPLGRLAGASQRAGGGDDPVERRRQRLAAAGPLARFGWSWLVALDQVTFYNLRARLPALVGRVVVCDRYAYDAAVDMDWALPADAHWSRLAIAAMLKLVPRPQLAYLLDVAAPAARQRKPEDPWHMDFEGERQRYHALAKRLGLRVLSTEGTFAEANDVLIREAIMAYMAHFETWLNGVFRANPSQMNRPDLAWARGAAR